MEVLSLCDVVRQVAYDIHAFLGHGHLEKVYENALVHRLRKVGLKVTLDPRQRMRWRGEQQRPVSPKQERRATCQRQAGRARPRRGRVKVFDEDGTPIGNYLADLLIEDVLLVT